MALVVRSDEESFMSLLPDFLGKSESGELTGQLSCTSLMISVRCAGISRLAWFKGARSSDGAPSSSSDLGFPFLLMTKACSSHHFWAGM